MCCVGYATRWLVTQRHDTLMHALVPVARCAGAAGGHAAAAGGRGGRGGGSRRHVSSHGGQGVWRGWRVCCVARSGSLPAAGATHSHGAGAPVDPAAHTLSRHNTHTHTHTHTRTQTRCPRRAALPARCACWRLSGWRRCRRRLPRARRWRASARRGGGWPGRARCWRR
jgi:hypothetical protein